MGLTTGGDAELTTGGDAEPPLAALAELATFTATSEAGELGV
jgi:hypothetical protein